MSEDGFAEPGGRDKGGSVAPPRQRETGPALRLTYLDGLRAVAAVYVVMFHAVSGFAGDGLTGPWRLLRRGFAFGHEAVAIFIVLSGYCLMLPVAGRGAQTARVDLGRFLQRRAWRILPPYFVTLGVSLAMLGALPALRTPGSGTIWDNSLPGLATTPIVAHLLLVHNWCPALAYQINGPLWSVASEWQIYFLFPLVLLPAWRRFGVLGTLLVAALIGYVPLWLAPEAALTAIPWYVLLFVFGMVAAAIRNSGASSPYVRLCGRLSAGLWAACFVLSMAFAHTWFRHKPVTDVLVGLATATLLVYLTEQALAPAPSRSHLLRCLESRSLTRLGHFSYSLYLTHLPVVALCYFALKNHGFSPAALALWLLGLGVATSLIFAYAFHLAVEQRFMHRTERASAR